MRMPPSTASGGTAIPSGREISSPTGRWRPSWPGSGIDLVLANIVADVIIPLSAQVGRLSWTQDGVFLCSGIIDTRAHEVEEALVRERADRHSSRREKNGWVALEARCPSPRG